MSTPDWDEISGDGSAELEDDGTIEVELSFDKATTPSLPVDANDFFNSLLTRQRRREIASAQVHKKTANA